jgi:ABC-type sulfate transport system substrate-binding protein
LIPADWQARLPDNSSPYYSTIVFLVRKGNPKGIRDWDDLVKDPACRSSRPTRRPRAGRAGTIWPPGNSPNARRAAMKRRPRRSSRLFKNVPVLDSGARGSTTTFAQRGIGDVFISWENEAFLALKEFGRRSV